MKSIIQIQRSSFLSARIRNQTAHYSQAKLSETISAPVAPRIIALPDKIDDAIKTQLSKSEIPLKFLRSIYRRIDAALQSQNRPSDTHVSPKEQHVNIVKLKEAKKKVIQYGPMETMAYLATQTAIQYSLAKRIMLELKFQDAVHKRNFRPRSLLDFGTGPGTNIWTAREIWGTHEWEKILAVDLSESMLNTASEILKETEGKLDPAIHLSRYLPLKSSSPSYDLVCSFHTLSELPNDNIRALTIRSLWEKTSDSLILAESGSSEGFRIIANARQLILDENPESAHVVAPCPHDGTCPLLEAGKICHFSHGAQRNLHMMTVKRSTVNNEKFDYSYVIIRRGKRDTSQNHDFGRLISTPVKRKRNIFMELCHSSGSIQKRPVTKEHDATVFKAARKARSGDYWTESDDSAIDTKKE